MIDLQKVIGQKGKPFSELSRLYTVREKQTDPNTVRAEKNWGGSYIESHIESIFGFPDQPNFKFQIPLKKLTSKALQG
jgi:hypothetical protein